MSSFDVQTSKIKGLSNEYKKVSNDLTKINGKISKNQKNLKSYIDYDDYVLVNDYLNKVYLLLENDIKKIEKLGSSLETISQIYENTENNLTNSSIKYTELKETTSNYTVDIDEKETTQNILDELSKLLNYYKGTDSETAKLISSLIDLINGGLDFDINDSATEWYQKLVSTGGDLFNVLDAVFVVGAASKNLDVMKWLYDNGFENAGLVADAFSFSSKFLDAFYNSDSVADFFDNIASVGGSAGSVIKDLIESKGYDVASTAVLPYTTLFSMVCDSIGDIANYSSDGHPLTGQELADSLISVGLTGANSLISGYTHGFISFDVDASTEIFDNRTSQVSQMIQDTNLPVGVQAGIAVLSSPLVAAWCVGETFYDKGVNIGNKLVSFFNR